MANTTVYPFGTGGQLPSSIGIVNDRTTGGADKAWSAEQGKLLYLDSNVNKTIDTSMRNDLGYFIGSLNVYASHGTYKGFFLMVSAGETYKLTASSVATIFAVVKNNTISDNMSVPYATGMSRTILLADTTQYVTIPSDGTYMFVQSVMGSGACIPTIVRMSLASDEVDELDEELGDLGLGSWTAADMSGKVTYNNIFVGGSTGGVYYPDKWITTSGRNCGIFPIPSGAQFMKVTTNLAAGVVMFILRDNKAPANLVQAECSSAYVDGRVTVPANADVVYRLYEDCKHIAYMENSVAGGETITLTPKFYFSSSPTSVADKFEEGAIIGGQINSVEFNDEPTPCISTSDTGATVDSGYIGGISVLKISESMYYMYYNCCPAGSVSDSGMKPAIAHSTDGATWTRGVPSGVEPPVSGSTLLMDEHLCAICVVKVPDSTYPYRMVGSKWHQSTGFYRSSDGINWELIRSYNYYYDCQPSLIVRGNMIKVYMRRRDAETKQIRYIGVCTIDLDGNLISQPTILFGKYLYCPNASRLDDRRDILFPTYFNKDDSAAFLTCYIADGNKITPLDVDFSTIITANDKWMEASPNIVNIGDSMYMFLRVSDGLHDDPYPKTSDIIRAKVTFPRTGLDGAYWT